MAVTDVITADLCRVQLRDGHNLLPETGDDMQGIREVSLATTKRLISFDEHLVKFQDAELCANFFLLNFCSQVLKCGAICNNADIVSGLELRGQPTESALLLAADRMGVYDIRNDYVR